MDISENTIEPIREDPLEDKIQQLMRAYPKLGLTVNPGKTLCYDPSSTTVNWRDTGCIIKAQTKRRPVWPSPAPPKGSL